MIIHSAGGRTYFPNMLSTGLDHWNFPNGKHGNSPDLIPLTCLEDADDNTICYGNNNTNRESNEASMKQGMLKRVTYPTKGYTELDYEANEYVQETTDNEAIKIINAASCITSEPFCCGATYIDETVYLTEDMLNTGYFTFSFLPIFDLEDACGEYANQSFSLKITHVETGNVRTIGWNGSAYSLNRPFSYYHPFNFMKTAGNYRFQVTSNYGRSLLSVYVNTDYVVKDCGGLRIKSTRTHDGISTSRDIVRTFHYGAIGDENKPSSTLYNMPQYAYPLNLNYSVLFNSSSIVPLSGMEGYHIGYSRVVVKQNGNGSMEYDFNQENSTDIYSSYPFPPTKLRVIAGTPQLTTTYNEDGAVLSYQLVERNADFYTTLNKTMFRATRVQTHYLDGDFLNSVYYKIYTPRTSIYRVGKMTNMLDGVSTITNYQYSNPITTLAPSVIFTTNSDGKTREENITYSIDHPINHIRDYFIEKNQILLPLQRDIYDGGNWIDGSRITYAFFDINGENPNTFYLQNGIVRPYQIERWERTWDGVNIQAGSWQLQRTNKKYTADGFIKEIQKPYWSPLSYTYSNKLQTQDKFLTFENDYSYYTGSTLLNKKTNVDGTSTTITYDALMRTKTVKDDCKNITTTYDYHFSSGSDRNYIKTTTTYPTKAFSDISSISTINYMDGLGRTIETVEQNQAPDSAHDIIKAVEYDNQGRIKRQFEPRQASNNNGAYQAPNFTWKHTLNEYYDSPLNRLHKVTPSDWNYPTIYDYRANNSADAVNSFSLNGAVNGTYSDNLLYKRTVIDGNGNKSITFSDKKGRTLLNRRTNGSETASLHYDTYYIYDDKNRRVMVLPPNTNNTQKELIFECQYDGEDRKIMNKVPSNLHFALPNKKIAR